MLHKLPQHTPDCSEHVQPTTVPRIDPLQLQKWQLQYYSSDPTAHCQEPRLQEHALSGVSASCRQYYRVLYSSCLIQYRYIDTGGSNILPALQKHLGEPEARNYGMHVSRSISKPQTLSMYKLNYRSSLSQSVSYFTVPPRAHPSTGSQSDSAAPVQPQVPSTRSRGAGATHVSQVRGNG